MKRIVLVIAAFLVGIVVSPFVPFVMAYMAVVGDFDHNFNLE